MPVGPDRKKASRFLQVAVQKGLIDKDQARTVLTRVNRGEGPPEALLVSDGLLTDHVVETINRALAAADGPKRIGGYRIVGKLGQGGMGAVYKAVQESIERDVALKVIPRPLMSDPGLRERFLREGRAAGKVNHPNVITVHDVGEDGGRLYMAMELVLGGDAERLAKKHGGKLPERLALQVIRDACKGLAAVHAAGLVHRDIKPANILLSPDGQAKLADLGLARSNAGDDRLTMTGTTIGTPSYMSPEQANGEAAIDIRADIYSLGATLFALLCGTPPFSGPTPFSVVAQVINEPTPDPRRVNPAISKAAAMLTMRAMAKQPQQRYASPVELLDAIDTVISGGEPVGVPTPGIPAFLGDRRWQIAGGAVGAICLILVGILLVWMIRGSDDTGSGSPPSSPDVVQPAATFSPSPESPDVPPTGPTDRHAPSVKPEPPLCYAAGLVLTRPAQTCRAIDGGILGRCYRSEILPGPRRVIDAVLTGFGDQLGVAFEDLLRSTDRFELRLVTDDRLPARRPGQEVTETIIITPRHHAMMWQRLATHLGKPADLEALFLDDTGFTRVEHGLRSIANIQRLPPITEPCSPIPGDCDLHAFINPVLTAFHGPPPPERGIPHELVDRLRLEATVRFEGDRDRLEVRMPGIDGALPGPDRSLIRFLPDDLLAMGMLGVAGSRLLELLTWRDLLTSEDRLDQYRRETTGAGLPDLETALADWHGSLVFAISEGAFQPHLFLAFPARPDFDRHVIRRLGLDLAAIDQLDRQPVVLDTDTPPWAFQAIRIEGSWCLSTDRGHLEQLLAHQQGAVRRPLHRPRLIDPEIRRPLDPEEITRRISEKRPLLKALLERIDQPLEPGTHRIGWLTIQNTEVVKVLLPILERVGTDWPVPAKRRLDAVLTFLRSEGGGLRPTTVDLLGGPDGLILRADDLLQWVLLPASAFALETP